LTSTRVIANGISAYLWIEGNNLALPFGFVQSPKKRSAPAR